MTLQNDDIFDFQLMRHPLIELSHLSGLSQVLNGRMVDVKAHPVITTREVAKDQQLCEKLTVLCSAPGTLKTLSRYAVRRSLGLQYLPDAVKGLPLPASLKEYLLLVE